MRISGRGLAVSAMMAGLVLGYVPKSNIVAAQPGITETAAGNSGRALYVKVGCYQCHGRVGQGGVAGPPLAGSPLPYAAFAKLTRNPRWNMPPYSQKSLSDEELQKIYGYVRELSR
jgi:ubiquinol-cytochrome c reductase cytochrome c subunit